MRDVQQLVDDAGSQINAHENIAQSAKNAGQAAGDLGESSLALIEELRAAGITNAPLENAVRDGIDYMKLSKQSAKDAQNAFKEAHDIAQALVREGDMPQPRSGGGPKP